MTHQPKRLIETDLPIKRISAHARREKSIRHGHISTLHIWWARRPLAACRAVLCAALWPDPADPLCPPTFRQAAITHLSQFAQKMMQSDKYHSAASEYALGQWRTMADTHTQFEPDHPTHRTALQGALLNFIADFANWDNATNDLYLSTARALTQAAHESLGGLPGTRPLVVDPFAGGGAIPLEALRVGADAFASDLNPVAVLLNKVVLEYIPRYRQQLADEVRKWGQWVKEQAEQELAQFYPPDPDGAIPIAYLWARTITCEGPGCGAEVPLMRSFWLSKRSGNTVGLKLVPDRESKKIEVELLTNPKLKEIGHGTIKQGAATCPRCGYTIPATSIRNQLKERKGGTYDARLICVVTKNPIQKGRSYRLPQEKDFKALSSASINITSLQNDSLSKLGISVIPDEQISLNEIRRIAVPIYGMNSWSDLFTSRQLIVITTLVKILQNLSEKTTIKDVEFRKAVVSCLAMAVDRHIDQQSSIVTWIPNIEAVSHTFTRQSLPMCWDFCEPNPLSDSGGNIEGAIEWVYKILDQEQKAIRIPGTVQKESATASPLSNDLANAIFTDPPYYDAVPYAYLSDYFYVWLRRMLGTQYPELFTQDAVPKAEEIVVDRSHKLSSSNKGIDFYESELTKAFAESQRILKSMGICVIVFASKTTASWESILQAVLTGGWIITGSWPIDTERTARVSAQGQARLSSSIHIVCRPRETNEIGDWREVLQELPGRIHAWLPRLAQEGVVGADAIFACLGPALEIFSRYARVEKASGEPVPLGEYLEHVWAAVSKEALNMVFAGADTTGFEEDARLTAIWLWTLAAGKDELGIMKDEEGEGSGDEEESGKGKGKPSAGYVLEYDAARKIAQGLGAHLEQLTNLVEIKGENARLLPVVERGKALFGQNALHTGSRPASTRRTTAQLSLFELLPPEEADTWRMEEQITLQPGQTTLDKIHQSMLLFAAGRSDALKQFLVHNGVGQDERFWRLAQALSALYPSHTDEKRWVDGVLARKKSLGF